MVPFLLSIPLGHPRDGFNEEILFAAITLSFLVFFVMSSWLRSKKHEAAKQQMENNGRRPIA